MRLHLLGCTLATTMVLGACAESPKPTTDDFGYKGTGIAVSVAPLTLDSLSDACYSFAITNEAGDLVVGRGPGAVEVHGSSLVFGTAANTICASRFGNGAGGDASYVAPCDASINGADDPDSDGANTHTVRLWVDALCASGTPVTSGTPNWDTAAAPAPNSLSTICTEIQAYQNPCGAAGCSIDVACAENADTPVTFNFTIMGQADQGFFDLAVNFSDVFCSAKLDTCYGEDANSPPIRMLFDPISKERINTAVLALACTAGSDAVGGTYLHMGNVEVTCGGTVVATLDLSTVTQEGNQAPVTTPTGDIVWAVYYGSEALETAGGDSWNKEYFNVAVANFGANCSLSWAATASEGPDLSSATSTSANTYNTYPVINYNDDITGDGGAWLCDQNGVNEPGSGVVTGNPSCTTPGGCLEGPCATLSPTGAIIDCDAGVPVEACAPNTPIKVNIGFGDAGASALQTLVLEPSAGGSTPPSYTITLLNNSGVTIDVEVSFNGTQWEFNGSGDGGQLVLTNPTLEGSWDLTGISDIPFNSLQIVCGGALTYACATWPQSEDPGYAQGTLIPTTINGPTGTLEGWGFLFEGGGVFHTNSAGTWQLEAPSGFNADTGVAFNQAPWGTYDVTGVDPQDGGDLTIAVTIAEGPCEPPEPPATPVPPHVWATYGNNIERNWRLDTIGAVPPGTGVTAAEMTWQTGHRRPYSQFGNDVEHRMDAMHDVERNRMFVSNANRADVFLPLRITTYTSPDDIANVTISTASTSAAWGSVSGLTNTGNLFLANGFIRGAGATHFLAAQIGTKSGASGMHFFILTVVDGATDIVVADAGSYVPDDYPATSAAWANVSGADYRNFWLDSATGEAFLSGPGFATGQSAATVYVNRLDVEPVVPAVTLIAGAITVPSVMSFHGLLPDGDNIVYTRASADGDMVFGVRNVVTGNVDFENETDGVQLDGMYYLNFGTYNPSNGLWVGLVPGANAVFNWGILGTDIGSMDGSFSPAATFSLSQKYQGLATFQP
jgi:hypothetical protein